MKAEPDPVRRRRTLVAGQRGEWIALLWLSLRGYRLLARRYAVRGGEIDLIVRRGACVVFVEVKARPTLEAALSAVTAAQQRRIDRAAAVWLSRNPWASACTLRGDLVAVAPWCRPRHLAGALPLSVGH